MFTVTVDYTVRATKILGTYLQDSKTELVSRLNRAVRASIQLVVVDKVLLVKLALVKLLILGLSLILIIVVLPVPG